MREVIRAFAARIGAFLVPILLATGGCRSTSVAGSDWPPADFYLEVRARTQTKDRLVERQSLHVFADGFVVYREADPADAFDGDWPPVFSRVCAYRLLPQSTRSLARGLYQAGLFQSATVVGTEVDAEDVIAIRLRAFGNDRRAVGRGRIYGSFIDVLHVVNAYLPPGCTFALPDMTGEPQPSRLARVPAPVRSVAGAHELHTRWREVWGDPDVQWRVEQIALAARAGDMPAARELFRELELEQARQVAAFPDANASDSLERLRGVLQ